MIGLIVGKIVEKTEDFVVVETASGVGYRVRISVACQYWQNLELEQTSRIWTSHYTRENEEGLFGFETPQERNFFELLTTVSGVGPKLAATLLAHLDQKSIAEMIFAEDVTGITAVPGIGKKMAERLIVDLKDKVLSDGDAKKSGCKKATGSEKHSENLALVRSGLEKLGFVGTEVDEMLEQAAKLFDEGMGVDEVVGQVLSQ